MHWCHLTRSKQHAVTCCAAGRFWRTLQPVRPSAMAEHSTSSLGAKLLFQGSLREMERAPTLSELHQQLVDSMQSVQAFKEANPQVENLTKLSNRIKRDLLFVLRQQQLLAEAQQGTQNNIEECTEDLEQWGGLKESRLQGIVNNLRGFHGELLALHEAPRIVAVCKKFSTQPPKLWAPSCDITQKPARKSSSTRQSHAAAAEGAAELTEKQQLPQQQAGDGTAVAAQATCWWEDGTASADDSSSDTGSSSYGSSPVLEGGVGDEGSPNCSRNKLGRQQQQLQQRSGLASQHTYELNDVQTEAAAASGAAASTNGSPSSLDPVVVEVDVVANDGLTWIEVKNQERFGIDSVHFTGSSHAKGLAQQVADLKAVAAAPVNSRRWRSPEIVVYFPSGVSEEVARALDDLGAIVAVGQGSLEGLPVPQPPSVTNLDVTSLCALVSEVSWGDPNSPALQAWAARTVHWQECLAAQVKQPLLPELHACLDNSQQLVTSCSAVEQFQKLMDMFSGPREKQRWEQLLQRVAVYHCSDIAGQQQQQQQGSMPSVCSCCGASLSAGSSSTTSDTTGAAIVAAAGCGVADVQHETSSINGLCPQHQLRQEQVSLYSAPRRIRCIDKLGTQQRAVFGLGDALQALTLTANGNAVRCCEQYGVKLEVMLHRPVWLTGL